MKNNFEKIFILAAVFFGVVLVLSLAGNIILAKKNNQGRNGKITDVIIKSVSAREIYPMFICPCCGKSIAAECCGLAKERKLYVDGLTQGRLTKDEVITAYVRKYGIDSFKDETRKEEFRASLIQSAPSERPIISLEPSSYDFGDVSQKKGVVTTFFELKNTGKSDLIINKLETSCGCTSAAIVYQGKEGPRFAMPGHGINEKIKGWQVNIAPGDTAKLKVYYDPWVHKKFRGPAIREIYVFSNDPIDFEKKVRVELEQVD